MRVVLILLAAVVILAAGCADANSDVPQPAEPMTSAETTPITYPARISPYIDTGKADETASQNNADTDSIDAGAETPATEPDTEPPVEITEPITLPQGSLTVKTSPSNPKIRDGRSYSFVAVGDNVVHTGIWLEAKLRAQSRDDREYYFAPVFDEIAGMIKDADIAFINQETLMGGDELGISNYPRFNSPQDIGRDIVDLGFDIVNIANNHMADKGEAGLRGTIDFWESQPVVMIGGYRNYADYQKVRTIERDGVKIALLSYTFSTNGLSLPQNTELYVPYIDYAEITAQVAAAKKSADLVFVSIHWGVENVFTPNSQQVSLAQYMADLGVDVIIGHHPHVVQPITWLSGKNGNDTLCVYSLGNIVSLMMAPYNMVGGVLTFDICEDRGSESWFISGVQFVPTVFFYGTNYYSQRIYLMRNFTENLASRMGTQNYGYTATLAQLRGYVTQTIDPAFLPDYMK
jgi:hypothetical protein